MVATSRAVGAGSWDLDPAMLCQCVLSLHEGVCEERYRNKATH